MVTVVFLMFIWSMLGVGISCKIACLMHGLASFDAFTDYMFQASFFFGIERIYIWAYSGAFIGFIVSIFVHWKRLQELRESDPTYIQWKRSQELRKQDPSYNEKKPTYKGTKPSVFNVIMQLLGCIIGTYISYKTGSALAFPMFYVPFSIAGLILN